MTDLRKQVFQAIEQLAFHYQGDKDDLEKLIDVVVELLQKREMIDDEKWLMVTESYIQKREAEAYKRGYIEGAVNEIVNTDEARKEVESQLKPTQVDDKGDSDE